MLQELQLAERQQRAEQAAGNGQQQRLREQLARQTAGCRTQRDTKGELAAPRGGLADHEIRHIHNRDQQHERDRAQQQQAPLP